MEVLILQIKLSACSTNHYTVQISDPVPFEQPKWKNSFQKLLRNIVGRVG